MLNTLAFYLRSLGCFDVRPCKVTIGRETYEGCRYKQTMQPLAGARSQEPYTVEAFYLLASALPACYRRSSHVAFTLEGDTREWYVAGHSACLMPGNSKFAQHHRAEWKERQEAQPFSPYFLLHPQEAGEIDRHEERPYRRAPMTVEYCDESAFPPPCDTCGLSLCSLDCESEESAAAPIGA